MSNEGIVPEVGLRLRLVARLVSFLGLRPAAGVRGIAAA